VTVYSILPGRGSEQLKQILGADYDAWLLHDGLRCYLSLDQANHQTCLTHSIRRCKEMAERATPVAAQFPWQVKTLLQQALLLGDRYELQQVTPHGLAVATGRLEAAVDRLLDKDYRTASNRRLAKHLRQQRDSLFTFLHCPGLEGTNNRAERAIRPAVIARKVWGGNRTWSGANVQQIHAEGVRCDFPSSAPRARNALKSQDEAGVCRRKDRAVGRKGQPAQHLPCGKKALFPDGKTPPNRPWWWVTFGEQSRVISRECRRTRRIPSEYSRPGPTQILPPGIAFCSVFRTRVLKSAEKCCTTNYQIAIGSRQSVRFSERRAGWLDLIFGENDTIWTSRKC